MEVQPVDAESSDGMEEAMRVAAEETQKKALEETKSVPAASATETEEPAADPETEEPAVDDVLELDPEAGVDTSSVDLLANDAPTEGDVTVTVSEPPAGLLVAVEDGVLTAKSIGFKGVADLTYTVTDESGMSYEGNVRVNVLGTTTVKDDISVEPVTGTTTPAESYHTFSVTGPDQTVEEIQVDGPPDGDVLAYLDTVGQQLQASQTQPNWHMSHSTTVNDDGTATITVVRARPPQHGGRHTYTYDVEYMGPTTTSAVEGSTMASSTAFNVLANDDPSLIDNVVTAVNGQPNYVAQQTGSIVGSDLVASPATVATSGGGTATVFVAADGTATVELSDDVDRSIAQTVAFTYTVMRDDGAEVTEEASVTFQPGLPEVQTRQFGTAVPAAAPVAIPQQPDPIQTGANGGYLVDVNGDEVEVLPERDYVVTVDVAYSYENWYFGPGDGSGTGGGGKVDTTDTYEITITADEQQQYAAQTGRPITFADLQDMAQSKATEQVPARHALRYGDEDDEVILSSIQTTPPTKDDVDALLPSQGGDTYLVGYGDGGTNSQSSAFFIQGDLDFRFDESGETLGLLSVGVYSDAGSTTYNNSDDVTFSLENAYAIVDGQRVDLTDVVYVGSSIGLDGQFELGIAPTQTLQQSEFEGATIVIELAAEVDGETFTTELYINPDAATQGAQYSEGLSVANQFNADVTSTTALNGVPADGIWQTVSSEIGGERPTVVTVTGEEGPVEITIPDDAVKGGDAAIATFVESYITTNFKEFKANLSDGEVNSVSATVNSQTGAASVVFKYEYDSGGWVGSSESTLNFGGSVQIGVLAPTSQELATLDVTLEGEGAAVSYFGPDADFDPSKPPVIVTFDQVGLEGSFDNPLGSGPDIPFNFDTDITSMSLSSSMNQTDRDFFNEHFEFHEDQSGTISIRQIKNFDAEAPLNLKLDVGLVGGEKVTADYTLNGSAVTYPDREIPEDLTNPTTGAGGVDLTNTVMYAYLANNEVTLNGVTVTPELISDFASDITGVVPSIMSDTEALRGLGLNDEQITEVQQSLLIYTMGASAPGYVNVDPAEIKGPVDTLVEFLGKNAGLTDPDEITAKGNEILETASAAERLDIIKTYFGEDADPAAIGRELVSLMSGLPFDATEGFKDPTTGEVPDDPADTSFTSFITQLRTDGEEQAADELVQLFGGLVGIFDEQTFALFSSQIAEVPELAGAVVQDTLTELLDYESDVAEGYGDQLYDLWADGELSDEDILLLIEDEEFVDAFLDSIQAVLENNGYEGDLVRTDAAGRTALSLEALISKFDKIQSFNIDRDLTPDKAAAQGILKALGAAGTIERAFAGDDTTNDLLNGLGLGLLGAGLQALDMDAHRGVFKTQYGNSRGDSVRVTTAAFFTMGRIGIIGNRLFGEEDVTTRERTALTLDFVGAYASSNRLLWRVAEYMSTGDSAELLANGNRHYMLDFAGGQRKLIPSVLAETPLYEDALDVEAFKQLRQDNIEFLDTLVRRVDDDGTVFFLQQKDDGGFVKDANGDHVRYSVEQRSNLANETYNKVIVVGEDGVERVFEKVAEEVFDPVTGERLIDPTTGQPLKRSMGKWGEDMATASLGANIVVEFDGSAGSMTTAKTIVNANVGDEIHVGGKLVQVTQDMYDRAVVGIIYWDGADKFADKNFGYALTDVAPGSEISLLGQGDVTLTQKHLDLFDEMFATENWESILTTDVGSEVTGNGFTRTVTDADKTAAAAVQKQATQGFWTVDKADRVIAGGVGDVFIYDGKAVEITPLMKAEADAFKNSKSLVNEADQAIRTLVGGVGNGITAADVDLAERFLVENLWEQILNPDNLGLETVLDDGTVVSFDFDDDIRAQAERQKFLTNNLDEILQADIGAPIISGNTFEFIFPEHKADALRIVGDNWEALSTADVGDAVQLRSGVTVTVEAGMIESAKEFDLIQKNLPQFESANVGDTITVRAADGALSQVLVTGDHKSQVGQLQHTNQRKLATTLVARQGASAILEADVGSRIIMPNGERIAVTNDLKAQAQIEFDSQRNAKAISAASVGDEITLTDGRKITVTQAHKRAATVHEQSGRSVDPTFKYDAEGPKSLRARVMREIFGADQFAIGFARLKNVFAKEAVTGGWADRLTRVGAQAQDVGAGLFRIGTGAARMLANLGEVANLGYDIYTLVDSFKNGDNVDRGFAVTNAVLGAVGFASYVLSFMGPAALAGPLGWAAIGASFVVALVASVWPRDAPDPTNEDIYGDTFAFLTGNNEYGVNFLEGAPQVKFSDEYDSVTFQNGELLIPKGLTPEEMGEQIAKVVGDAYDNQGADWVQQLWQFYSLHEQVAA